MKKRIGSAIISQIEKLADSQDLVQRVGEFTRSLVASADNGRGAYECP